MRLRGLRRSTRVVDRRGRGGVAAGGLGLFGVVAVLAIGYFTGIDVRPLLQGTTQPSTAPRELSAAEERAGDFVAAVLATTEDVWGTVFPEQLGEPYDPPELILFSQFTDSGCGSASAATGPFYCPGDERAYLDTAFFATLAERLGAEGDFASAYVIAHEIAHHVQNELGVLPSVNAERQQLPEAQANALSVRTELQADCLAGVWAFHVEDLLEPGDLQEALDAAWRIGDDYLQERAGRAPNPHTFQHGTSEQRASWFERGYRSGQVDECDTFAAEAL